MRRSPLPAADLHGAAPLGSAARFRGRSQGERGALVRHRGGFGVSRSTPAVRAAERRSKRSMAVRPSLTSAESDSVHAARRTPPGSRAPRRDEKDWTRTPSPCRSRVAGAELRAGDADPPRPASSLTRRRVNWKSLTKTDPTSGCRRRGEGTGAARFPIPRGHQLLPRGPCGARARSPSSPEPWENSPV